MCYEGPCLSASYFVMYATEHHVVLSLLKMRILVYRTHFIGLLSRDVRDIQSEKSEIKRLLKAPEKELKNVFVMKLNAESLRIYKTTLPS